MGNFYTSTILTNTTASTNSAGWYSAGTTWDASWGSARPIEYNGNVIRMGAPVAVVPEPKDEGPMEWLRRRVEEYRVDLADAA